MDELMKELEQYSAEALPQLDTELSELEKDWDFSELHTILDDSSIELKTLADTGLDVEFPEVELPKLDIEVPELEFEIPELDFSQLDGNGLFLDN